MGANDRINMALVGLGGRGQNHLNIYSRLPESRVVALCDVNQAARERSQGVLAKVGAEKANEIEDMRALIHRQLSSVHNAHVQTGLDGVIQECRMHQIGRAHV